MAFAGTGRKRKPSEYLAQCSPSRVGQAGGQWKCRSICRGLKQPREATAGTRAGKQGPGLFSLERRMFVGDLITGGYKERHYPFKRNHKEKTRGNGYKLIYRFSWTAKEHFS